MPTAAALLGELKVELHEVGVRFIEKWIPAQPEHTPDDFQHDVKAYCVLAHAAFEEFAEEISLVAMKDASDAWLSKRFSRTVVALLLAYGPKLEAVVDEDASQDRLFDQVRKRLDECAKQHSRALAGNHGFSLKYLRTILTPVGVDIPESVKLNESLKELARARGSYAHSRAKLAAYGEWKRADRRMAPEQAKATVLDCLELCEELASALPAPA